MEKKEDAATSETNECKLTINRSIYTLKKFNEQYSIKEPVKRNKSSSLLSALDPRRLLGIFTILNLITEYNVKKDLVADIFSGLTVGIMHIPVSLAYGALTSLNPVNGLYTSFYTGLTYVLFGTSKHLSVGTYAVISLMVYSTISRLEGEYVETEEYLSYRNNLANSTNQTVSDIDEHIMDFRLKVATSLAFWCGIVQLVLAISRFGLIYKYLSKAMLRGFTTAAACYVFTTQLQHVFGIYARPRKSRLFLKFFFNYVRLFRNIHLINWTAVIISVISITFLIIFRIHINERFRKQLRNIPLPIELVVIIAGTSLSYFLKLNQNYKIAVVGEIPSGLSAPTLPEFKMFPSVIQDAVIISIVAFASSISVADLYARKHKYKIDSNREIFALGMSNIVGSFFKSFTCCGALARTVVLESSGGRTQLVTIIASGIIMAVLLWISPLLEMLPKACLGSIIISALINLFKQFQDIKYYWKLDKRDFTLWIVTFISSILLDIDYGLCVGILTILILNTLRIQKIKVIELGHISDHETHFNLEKYHTSEYLQIKVVQPSQSIHYSNCDEFELKLNELCPLKDASEAKTLCENCSNNYNCIKCSSQKNENKNNNDDDEDNQKLNETRGLSANKSFKFIVIDFSLVHYVDECSVKCLQKIVLDYGKDRVNVLFANCNDTVKKFFTKLNCEWDNIIYLTINDAILSINL